MFEKGSATSVASRHQRLTSLSANLQVWGVPRPEPEPAFSGQDWPGSADTVTVKNIPCRIRSQEVLSAVRALGFTESDLLYLHLPVKQGRTPCTLGYCFISFRTAALARQFWEKSSDLRFPERNSLKVPHVEASTSATRSRARSMHGEVLWFRREAAAAVEVEVATGQDESLGS